MKLTDYIRSVRKEAVAPKDGFTYGPPPKGWFTVRQIQQALGMKWTANASTRAKNLYERGIVERMEWRNHYERAYARTFVYRLKPPLKSWQEAANSYHKVGEDKVPKGWMRPVEIGQRLFISAEAVRNLIYRHRIKYRHYKTARGPSGIHTNLYVRFEDIRRIHRKRL